MRAYSPIRSLEGRDTSRESLGVRRELKSQILQQQNQLLRRKLHQNTTNQTQLILRNSRLKQQVDILSLRAQQAATTRQYHSTRVQLNLQDQITFLARQNESLKLQVTSKTAELQSTLRQLTLLQEKYQAEINFLNVENKDLKERLMVGERDQAVEIETLRRKYTSLHLDDSEAMRSTHTQEVRFLLEEIDKLRGSLGDKATELQLQFQDRREMQERFDQEMILKNNDISNLKNQLLVLEASANKQIKDLTNKRELEKSRTVGIIQGSKESTAYLQREIRRLTADLAEKNSQLENLTRSYLAEKKKNQDSQRVFNDKLTQVRKEHEEELRDKMSQFEKREANLKEEILEKKKKETELYMQIDRLEKELEVAAHQKQLLKDALKDQDTEIKQLKSSAEKQREQHLKQITKIMNQKMKRRSSKVLSSQRSLNDSMKDSNLVELASGEQPAIPGQLIDNLPSVKEEVYLRESSKSKHNKSIMQEEQPDEENDEIAGLVAHYESMIEELKRTNQAQLEAMGLDIQKLKSALRDKQEQYEDILKRFAPLVKIHAGEKSLEQDRKERIQRHWKADIALLEVLLQKHKIRVL